MEKQLIAHRNYEQCLSEVWLLQYNTERTSELWIWRKSRYDTLFSLPYNFFRSWVLRIAVHILQSLWQHSKLVDIEEIRRSGTLSRSASFHSYEMSSFTHAHLQLGQVGHTSVKGENCHTLALSENAFISLYKRMCSKVPR